MQLKSAKRTVRELLEDVEAETAGTATKGKGAKALDEARTPKEAVRAIDRIIDDVESRLPYRGERAMASLAVAPEGATALSDKEIPLSVAEMTYPVLGDEMPAPISPELRPEVAPYKSPEPAADVAPDTMVERITDVASESPVEGVPERPTEGVSETPTEPAPERTPEKTPEKVPEKSLEKLPETPPEAPPETPPERPPEYPPERPPERPLETGIGEPPPTTLTRLGRAEIVGDEARLPEGSITWRQGIFWKWIPREDYTTGAAKPRTLPKGVIPMGAIKTDLRKPDETIQMVGDPGASVPDVDVDLGVSDVFIRDNAQTITFGGKGLKTNVGEGIDDPAKGMTIDGSGVPAKGHAYARKVYPKHSVSRTAITDESAEPVRGGGIREVRGKDRVDISERIEDEGEQEAYVKDTELPDLIEAGYGDEQYFDEAPEGAYFDEDPNWLKRNAQSKKNKKTKNRTSLTKTEPVRGSTVVRQVRP
jgi:hypothetical protein